MRPMQVHVEGPVLPSESPSHHMDSKMRIQPQAMCPGGHFLQRWMAGGLSAGLHWGCLSEGQRGPLKPRAGNRKESLPLNGCPLALGNHLPHHQGRACSLPTVHPAGAARLGRTVPFVLVALPFGAPSLFPQPHWSAQPGRKNPHPPPFLVEVASPLSSLPEGS